VLVLLLVSAQPGSAEGPVVVRGVVRDPSGAPVVGARVTVDAPAGPSVATSADGSFSFEAAGDGRLLVTAPGFAEVEGRWSATATEPLTLVLRPSRREEISVTASRTETRLGDTPERVVVLGRSDIAASAALTLDDTLRQVPGFTLFRRSGSRVANPTSQGASLRGVGPSGASRTLVLIDGVPLNDAFGGWVYWSRVCRAAVERVEVLEGGASDLYGSAALGGVVQALGRTDQTALVLDASLGSGETAVGSMFAAGRSGPWSARAAGEAFTTAGYVQVTEDERGPVDVAAGAAYLSGSLEVSRRLSPSAKAFVQASLLGESRENGTPLQTNDTDFQQASGGADWSGRTGAVSLRAWYGTQSYHQTFSALSADRTGEALTRRQHVPSKAGGLTLQWSRAVGAQHLLVAGVEGRSVRGRSDESVFAAGTATALVTAGGRQRTLALFASDRFSLGRRARLTLGARVDRWWEDDGSDATTPFATNVTSTTRYPDRVQTAVSPRLSALVRATPSLSLTAAGYGAFRAPTLNELYRGFRLGSTVTLANPELVEERLWGGEAGASWHARGDALRLRAVAFLGRISDPVANVTLLTTPQIITRRRQNLGRILARGLELEAEGRLGDHLVGSIGYALVDSVVESFAANPSLEGNAVPQVARHQATFQIRYSDRRSVDLALQGRAASRQFEDDQNRLVLPGYFTLDAHASRRLGAAATAFVALENLTGARFAVGLTPVQTLGPPFLARAGIRLDWNRATQRTSTSNPGIFPKLRRSRVTTR
jgi:outer membrane receptor protein involved in Fe transport